LKNYPEEWEESLELSEYAVENLEMVKS
jgi:hypothetical protein